MEHETDKIHVMPTDGKWEVEDQSGDPLTREDDKGDAIEAAKHIAQEEGISTVILHDGDGVTEEVPVPPKQSQPKTNQ